MRIAYNVHRTSYVVIGIWCLVLGVPYGVAANYPSGYDTFVQNFNGRKDTMGLYWINNPSPIQANAQREPWLGWRDAANHFGDPGGVLEGYANAVGDFWRDNYVMTQNPPGKVAARFIYAEGYIDDWNINGDAQSRDAVIRMAQNGELSQDSKPLSYVASESRSREAAYTTLAYLNAEVHFNQPHRIRMMAMIDLMLGDVGDQVSYTWYSNNTPYLNSVDLTNGGHIEQWLGDYTTDANGNYVSGNHRFHLGSPDKGTGIDTGYGAFMGAYTAYTLIRFNEQAAAGNINGGVVVSSDTRVLPKLIRLADATWNEYWIPADEAMKYRWFSNSGAPDLNNVIFPWYAWLYLQTGEDRFRDRAEKLFNGSRNSCGASGDIPESCAKQWNDYIRHTFVGLDWYDQGVTLHGSGGGENPPPPPPPPPPPSTTVNPPLLPQSQLDTIFNLPTCGNTVQVKAGDDLQAAINNANPCDVLVLEAGATFTGNFVLPNKPNPGNEWIYIISSALDQLPENKRVSPNDVHHMATLLNTSAASGKTTLTAHKGANHYRLAGIEFTHTNPTTNIILLGDGPNGGPSNVAELADNIIFDRSYIHGQPTVEVRQGFNIRCKRFGLVDSYVSEIHVLKDNSQIGADPLGVHLYISPGPSKIHNNYISASGENLFIGLTGNINFIPTDVTITNNYLHKPWKWKDGHPQYAGIRWVEKNLFEIKCANRLLFQGNVLQNAWNAEQEGAALLIKSPNQYVRDITVRYNEIIDANVAFGIAAQIYEMERLLIHDNLAYTVDQPGWRAIRLSKGGAHLLTDLAMVHNTVLGYTNHAVEFYGNKPAVDRMAFYDNIVSEGAYGIKGGGTESGLPAVTDFVTGYDFDNNILVGQGSYTGDANFKNFYFELIDDIGFTGPGRNSADDFKLEPASRFAQGNGQESTDGRDMGADIDTVISFTQCVKAGTCDPLPIEPDPEEPDNPEGPGSAPESEAPKNQEPKKFKNIISAEHGSEIEIECDDQVDIYDRRGNLVKSLMCVGGTVSWDGNNVPSGIYFVREDEKDTRKVVVIK